MSKLPILLLPCLLGFWFATAAWVVDAETLLQPDEAFQLISDIKDPQTVRLTWRIANGYYLYRQKFKFVSQSPEIEAGDATFPAGQHKLDQHFGNVEIYRNRLAVDLPIQRQIPHSSPLLLEVTFQGCAHAGVCYLPIQEILAIELPE